MVETAVKLAQAGKSCEEIVAAVEKMMETARSFLMPADFDYLRRGGRLSPLVSLVGKTIRLAPVLTQSEDGKQLVMHGIKLSFKQAIAHVSKTLKAHGVQGGWKIYVTHAMAPQLAQEAYDILVKDFPDAVFETYPLTPAFITQGGPDCVAVQVVKPL